MPSQWILRESKNEKSAESIATIGLKGWGKILMCGFSRLLAEYLLC